MKDRFSVFPSRHWVHTSGRTASLFGAVPYVRDAESEGWSIKDAGFTIYDSLNNTYGCGRPPFKTAQEAQALCDKFNAQ